MTQKSNKIDDLPGVKRSVSSGETTNNVVYLIVVEESLPKRKMRCFVAVKYTSAPSHLSFKGAEISHTQSDKISSYDDAIEAANKFKSPSILEMTYPWQKVLRIQNMTYRNKGN